MKRSAFLWITGLGAALLCVAKLNLARSFEFRVQRFTADLARPGRCQAARRMSRWSGYTIDELLA
jgi:hypothetical protein